MASAKRDIRQIIDSFSDDLILIAQDIARERVERAVLEWQAKNEKLLAKKSIQDEKAQRLEERARKNQKALERIERVAEKRRAREEQKAAERALRLEQRMIAGSSEKPEKKPGRGRKSGGLLGESAAKKEPTPPPLFVHKRRRDGEIQQLKRGDEEATVPAIATPSNDANRNGPTNPSPSTAVATGVPEQLRLGL
ncbi:MAG: hypothetical protein WDO69_06760 [Pseudomonadota bacterium]